jgi:uncharacterized membrane protein
MTVTEAPRGLHEPGSTAAGRVSDRTLGRLLTVESVVYAGMAAFAGLFATANALRYESFTSARFDLGNMTQAVWSTAHGRFLETTSEQGEQFVRLGVHVDPLLTVLAVPWLLWPSPLLLTTVLAVAVALGALPVFWLARKHLGSERVAAVFAFAYLLYPSTQWNAHFDFHAVSLAIPLLLFAIWYLDEDRFLMFLPFALAAAVTKEHMPLLVGWLGVWYAVRHGRRLLGFGTAVAGLVMFLAAAFAVLPHFTPAGLDLFADRYASLGGSPVGLVKTLLTDPKVVVHEIATRQDAAYVFVLLGAFGGLWALSPLLAAGFLPELALDLLSSKPEQTQIMYQYSAAIAPFVIAAAVLGAARLGAERQRRWCVVVLGLMLAMLVLSPLIHVPTYIHNLRSPAQSARVAAVSLIPVDAPVSATNRLGGHLSERRRIFLFPVVREAEWVVADANDPTMTSSVKDRAELQKRIDVVKADPAWREVFSEAGIFVFRREARDG